MTWPHRRAPFVAAPLEQAFWLASLATIADTSKRDRCVAAVMEMLVEGRARARA